MPSQSLAEQIETVVRLGYPAMFTMPENAFADALAALSEHVPDTPAPPELGSGQLPFVLVIDSDRTPTSATLPLVQRRGKSAVERLYPKSPADFSTIPQVQLPNGEAYLLLDVDRGADSLNITPDVAYVSIEGAGRSPLTIAEGVALLTQFPEFLQPNNCFSLLASRCGDKRVPALWLSEGRPKLGWCWAGNPHTWLGSASCSKRVGSVSIFDAVLSDA